MTDPTPPTDSFLETLRSRERVIVSDIADHERRLEMLLAVRDELRDLIETLTRKPRARRGRPPNETARPVADLPEFEADPQSTLGVRPSVFAAPTEEEGGG